MIRWPVGALWTTLAIAACVPVHPGRPLRDDCPARTPVSTDKCTGAADRYCVFTKSAGEDVCYCEDGRWQCFHASSSAPPIVGPSASATATPSAPPASASAPPPPPPPPEPKAKACPDNMQLVDAVHCTRVKRKCKRKSTGGPNNLIICHEFEEGTECVGDKRRQRFCVDRYEFPSKAGGHPPVMVNAYDAAGLCAEQGKRMCFESEWTAACEGPDELPFPAGHKRSKDICNIDNPYVHPKLAKAEHRDEKIHGPELTRLDQSVRSGSMETCKSGFGVYDLTGNFDEWVRTERIRGKSKWAGLKGGAWGTVRNACRPITTSHVAHWSYYFISFRCCKNPDESALPPLPQDGIPLWEPPSDEPPKHPARKPISHGFTPASK